MPGSPRSENHREQSLSGLAFYNQALMSNGGAFSVSNAGAGLLR